MEIEVTINKDHWKKYNKYIYKMKAREVGFGFGNFWVNLIVWCLLVMVFTILYRGLSHHQMHFPTVTFVFVIFVILFVFFIWFFKRFTDACAPSESGLLLGKHRYQFDKKGIKTIGNGYESFLRWSRILDIKTSKELIILFLDTVYAIILPIDQVEDHERFLLEIKNMKSAYDIST